MLYVGFRAISKAGSGKSKLDTSMMMLEFRTEMLLNATLEPPSAVIMDTTSAFAASLGFVSPHSTFASATGIIAR